MSRRKKIFSFLAFGLVFSSLSQPWRIIDGHTNYAAGPGWMEAHGRVLESYSDGIKVEGHYWPVHKPGRVGPSYHYFIKNFPYPIADGDYLGTNIIAKETGLRKIQTAVGATVTLHSLDYGKPCRAPSAPGTNSPPRK